MIKRIVAKFFLLHGQRLLADGKPSKAMKAFIKSDYLRSDDACRFNIAITHISLMDYQAAYFTLQQLSERHGENPNLLSFMAQCCIMMMRWNEAKEIYLGLAESHNKRTVYAQMAALLDDVAARDKYRLALELQHLSVLQEERGDFKEAVDSLCRAADLIPEDAKLQNNIAALLYKCKQPAEKALPYISKAIQLNPNNDVYKRNYRRIWQKIKR